MHRHWPASRRGLPWADENHLPPPRPTPTHTRICPPAQDLYISLHDLREFLHINKEGFRKIIKKHDKAGAGAAGRWGQLMRQLTVGRAGAALSACATRMCPPHNPTVSLPLNDAGLCRALPSL